MRVLCEAVVVLASNGTGLEQFVEPVDGRFAGSARYQRPLSPYDEFMQAEGLPVIREIGVCDVRELELADWPRMGGRGVSVQLLGTEGLWGMYVAEIPPGRALHPEHHLYEEVFYVVEGRGSTEVWVDDERAKTTFEWKAGSLFSVPLNAWHRLVNASRSRTLLIVGTTAPPVMNMFRNNEFVFGSDFKFRERYSGDPGWFEFRDAVWRGPVDGRAMMATNLVPDIVNTSLPYDNQRSPGYRRVEIRMAENSFYTWLGEHMPGRYSKGHAHPPSPVLICVKGEGYTYTWPREYGIRPFADGHAAKVLRQEYVPGGMVAAAPGGGDWFHQHFGISKEPLRFLYFGGLIRYSSFDSGVRPGETKPSINMNIEDGGSSIGYYQEDPHFREEFEQHLARNDVASLMDEKLYTIRDAAPA